MINSSFDWIVESIKSVHYKIRSREKKEYPYLILVRFGRGIKSECLTHILQGEAELMCEIFKDSKTKSTLGSTLGDLYSLMRCCIIIIWRRRFPFLFPLAKFIDCL